MSSKWQVAIKAADKFCSQSVNCYFKEERALKKNTLWLICDDLVSIWEGQVILNRPRLDDRRIGRSGASGLPTAVEDLHSQGRGSEEAGTGPPAISCCRADRQKRADIAEEVTGTIPVMCNVPNPR